MNKINLYKKIVCSSRSIISYGKAKKLDLNEAQRLELNRSFRLGEKHCSRMRCRAVLLKAEGLSSAKIGMQREDVFCFRERMDEALHSRRHRWSEDLPQSWSEAHYGLLGRGSGAPCHRAGQAVCEQGQDGL